MNSSWNFPQGQGFIPQAHKSNSANWNQPTNVKQPPIPFKGNDNLNGKHNINLDVLHKGQKHVLVQKEKLKHIGTNHNAVLPTLQQL